MRHKSEKTREKIIAFVEEYQRRHYDSPTVREIGEGVGVVGSTAYKYLVEMNDLGIIRYDGRSIKTRVSDKVDSEFMSIPVLAGLAPKTEEELFSDSNPVSYVNLPGIFLPAKGREYALLQFRSRSEDELFQNGDYLLLQRAKKVKAGLPSLAGKDGTGYYLIPAGQQRNTADGEKITAVVACVYHSL